MSQAQQDIDLAAERLGGEVLFATDDFFAPKENLLKPGAAVWIEDKYTDRGKWMDGWESRRRRTPGHDWADIRLGLPGVIRSVVVDTAFFRGNYPEHCSIEGCVGDPRTDPWVEILPKSALSGDSQNRFGIASLLRFTHLRLHIYPDGGVARFRVHGDGIPAWMEPGRTPPELDLAAVENGGRVVACSDMFFGSRHNLIMPGHSTHMGDGWETRRRRGPGHDWVIVELGTWGEIEAVDFDTSHFKGNAPGETSIEVCHVEPGHSLDTAEWRELLPRTKVSPHRLHRFHRQLQKSGQASHVRVNVYPDGGVARLRLYGVVTRPAGTWRLCGGSTPCGRSRPKRSCFVAAVPQNGSRRCWAGALTPASRRCTRPPRPTWWKLGSGDWKEAFACHPPIGARADAGHQDARGEGWSSQEQAGTASAPAAVTDALAEKNRAYRERFGYTFIVCATGRSGRGHVEHCRISSIE